MKNPRKQVLAMLLCALMLSSGVFSGCSGGADTGNDTTGQSETESNADAVTEETELTDGLEDVDMDGFEMRFLHAQADNINWVEVTLDAGADSGDILNQAIFLRNEYIRDRFNCELTFEEMVHTDIDSKYYKQYVMSGDDAHDIIMLNNTHVLNHVTDVADLNHIPYINFDADYWNPQGSSLFYMDGKRLAVSGNYSLASVSTANCLLFNKGIYEDLGINESLYDVVREGTWTIDKYFSVAALAQNDLNGDGTMDNNDRYGTTGTVKSLHNMFIVGAGLNWVDRDEDGFPVFNPSTNEKFVSYVEKIVNMEIAAPTIYYMPTNGIHSEDYPIRFEEGQALFFTCWPKNFFKIREMEDAFGVVPAPKYDENQSQYYANMANGEFTTLPRTYREDRLENIGILLEAMSFYTQQNVIPVYQDKVLDLKVTRDYESAEMLDLVFAGVTYDFGVNGWATDVSDKLIEKIFYVKSTAIVSQLVAIEPTIQANIEKLKTNVKEVP